MELVDFDEAVQDYEKALKMDNSRGKIFWTSFDYILYYRHIFSVVYNSNVLDLYREWKTTARGKAGLKKIKMQRLLQDIRNRQECI